MRKIAFLLALMLISSIAFSAILKDTLYFVSGEVYHFDENVDYYKKQPLLFSYNATTKGLDTTLVLRTSDRFTNLQFMTLYNTYGYLIFSESIYHEGVAPSLFTIIDLKSLQRKSIRVEQGLTGESNLFVLSPDSIYYCVQLIETKKDRGFTKDMKAKDFEPKDYNYAYIQGDIGSPINNVEYLILYNEVTNNNALHISQGYGLKVGPYLNLQPPKELYNAYPPALKAMVVNDMHSMIIQCDASPAKFEGIGFLNFVIYDKKSKEWYKYTLRGNMTSVRSYENGWVAGTIMERDDSDEKNSKSSIEHRYKRVPPGYEERDPILYDWPTGIWGDCFDERAINFNTYYPGLLYLFNVHTKDYIEWDTKQGDSEVLLVVGNTVYYRVNTKILKSAIINSKELGQPETLLYDIRARDIHWMYVK